MQIFITKFSESELEKYCSQLSSNSDGFPYAIMRAGDKTEVVMTRQECQTLAVQYIEMCEDFILQQYIAPEGLNVKVIRVYFSGLSIHARIFENTVNIDSSALPEAKYLLGTYNKSEKTILSLSTISLQNKAKSLHSLILSKLKRFNIKATHSLDFIKQDKFWYFISAHYSNNYPTLSTSPKSQGDLFRLPLSPKDSKYRLPASAVHHTRIIIPKSYVTERVLEQRVDQLIDKPNTPAIRHLSYKKWMESTNNKDILYRLYSQKIAQNKDKVKALHNQGLTTLKSLTGSMGDMLKHFKFEYKLTEFLTDEAGRLLLKIAYETRIGKKNRKKIEHKPPTINNVKVDVRASINYGSQQLDKMRNSLLLASERNKKLADIDE